MKKMPVEWMVIWGIVAYAVYYYNRHQLPWNSDDGTRKVVKIK